MEKKHLGDGCYVRFDGYHVSLTTENGISIQNEIHLDADVLNAFTSYICELREKTQPERFRQDKNGQVLNIGDKVEYIGGQNPDKGIVKSFPVTDNGAAFIVFGCTDWGNYKDYTSEFTKISEVTKGWTEQKLTQEQIQNIFDNTEGKWEGDNAFQGLEILSKYTSNLIIGAGHDVIWSVDVDEIIELGITKEDVTKLALLNWMIDADSFSCFV